MTLTTISLGPEKTNIICLNAARSKYAPGRCKHMNLTVDDELATVQCDDCGEKLNPIALLIRMTQEESRWQQRANDLKDLLQRFEEKHRCKCQHCGKFTNLRT